MNISVAMATYNGEKYIREQLNSILTQLNISDEIIISDDGSTDSTIDIIAEYMNNDKRVKIFKNDKLGVVKNFEFAIRKCNNDIIFLSDQDDIWLEEKINIVKENFKNDRKILVLHNAIDFYEAKDHNNGKLVNNRKSGVLQNIIASSYWGCCMAFNKELMELALPFPQKVIAHDQWIGLLLN